MLYKYTYRLMNTSGPLVFIQFNWTPTPNIRPRSVLRVNFPGRDFEFVKREKLDDHSVDHNE